MVRQRIFVAFFLWLSCCNLDRLAQTLSRDYHRSYFPPKSFALSRNLPFCRDGFCRHTETNDAVNPAPLATALPSLPGSAGKSRPRTSGCSSTPPARRPPSTHDSPPPPDRTLAVRIAALPPLLRGGPAAAQAVRSVGGPADKPRGPGGGSRRGRGVAGLGEGWAGKESPRCRTATNTGRRVKRETGVVQKELSTHFIDRPSLANSPPCLPPS